MKYTIEIDFDGKGRLLSFQEDEVKDIIRKFFEMNGMNPIFLSEEEIKCPHCSSEKYVKNGGTKDRPRFKCSNCSKTFSSITSTSVQGIHKVEKWSKFVLLMLSSKTPPTLTEISEKVGIRRSTAHSWKHKLLASFNEQSKIKLEGEIEVDEVFQSFCIKGVPGNTRSEEALEIEKEYKEKGENAVFLCAHNRDGDFDFQPLRIQRLGQIHSKYIKKAVENFDIKPGTTVITDKSKGSIKYFKTRKDINHLTFKSLEGETKELNNAHINSTMSHFNGWKRNFHGYSTKYIWNYLKWYRFHKLFVRFVENHTVADSEMEGLKVMVEKSVKDKNSRKRFQEIPQYYEEYLKRA